MSQLLTPMRIEESSWIIEMTPEMTRLVKVAEGSHLVLHLSEGTVEAEILPPAPPEIDEFVKRIAEKHRDAFEEMKRLGD